MHPFSDWMKPRSQTVQSDYLPTFTNIAKNFGNKTELVRLLCVQHYTLLTNS